MGKNDFLSPKDIANRIKAKGLQKLRWYCQMCGKQCRDENGFKCHLSSDSHKRQMEVFGQAPQRVIEGFSEEFEKSFLEHLRRSHPFSRISANVVYNEYIQDRNHIHMNSTKWVTLTEFVAHLGRSGQCKVDDTPKGWYIALVQKDPARELDEERRGKRERADREEEERHRRAMQAQIERARQAAASGAGDRADVAAAADVTLEDLERPLGFSLVPGRRPAAGSAEPPPPPQPQHKRPAPSAEFDDADDARPVVGGLGRGGGGGAGHKRSKLEELMERDLRAKQRHAAPSAPPPLAPQRAEHWVAEGIVVKVMSKALREHGYYKQKGEVLRLVEGGQGATMAEIEMAGSRDVVRVDEAELETVIPQPGGSVLVLRGPLRGARGTLVAIDEGRFQAEVAVEGSSTWLDYEDISKLATR